MRNGMLGSLARTGLAAGALSTILGGRRRTTFGRRRSGGFSRAGLAAPIAIGLGSWAYRRWQANRQTGFDSDSSAAPSASDVSPSNGSDDYSGLQ